MRVQCDGCGLTYDDEFKWTSCPHNPLEFGPEEDDYCKRHDLPGPCRMCTIVDNISASDRAILAQSRLDSTKLEGLRAALDAAKPPVPVSWETVDEQGSKALAALREHVEQTGDGHHRLHVLEQMVNASRVQTPLPEDKGPSSIEANLRDFVAKVRDVFKPYNGEDMVGDATPLKGESGHTKSGVDMGVGPDRTGYVLVERDMPNVQYFDPKTVQAALDGGEAMGLKGQEVAVTLPNGETRIVDMAEATIVDDPVTGSVTEQQKVMLNDWFQKMKAAPPSDHETLPTIDPTITIDQLTQALEAGVPTMAMLVLGGELNVVVMTPAPGSLETKIEALAFRIPPDNSGKVTIGSREVSTLVNWLFARMLVELKPDNG